MNGYERFLQGLLAARGHLAFMIGLVGATFLVILLEYWDGEIVLGERISIEAGRIAPLAAQRALTEDETRWAKISWRYFEENYQPDTGMVNSVDGFAVTTMWDTASYMQGLISAERLGIIDRATFDTRMELLLKTLASLPLFDGKLPNKAYNTQTLEMTDKNGTPAQVGWSALDIGRMMVPLNILVWNYPQHNTDVQRILAHWQLHEVVHDGLINSAEAADGEINLLQEGRIGYEEYCAKAFLLMGLDVQEAMRYDDFLKEVNIYGIDVPTDRRRPAKYHAHNYVVSEPYILDGIEFGFDEISREFAWRVYQAQYAHYQETGIPTAVSEDNIDRYPFFVYNTVYSSGKAWNAITEEGEDASMHRTLSTKAVFGWHALYGNDYTSMLIGEISGLYDPERGWYSGRYEADGTANTAITANTNGIVLSSLAYRQFGKMVNMYHGGLASLE